jgi:hypothetical protein
MVKLSHRLYYQMITVTAQDRFIARQFELMGIRTTW